MSTPLTDAVCLKIMDASDTVRILQLVNCAYNLENLLNKVNAKLEV